MKLPTLARALVAIAALLLGTLYVLPLWHIALGAPQYPEGLGLVIRINTITGQKPNDLNSINGLNHYIGMRPIEPDAIPELQWMPWILGGLIAFALVVAIVGRRKLLWGWLGTLVALGAAGLYDFWRWGYDYGHNLDEATAIIKVPGMTYSPPVLGTKQLLNFTATSLPAIGGWLAAVAFALGLAALWYAGRHPVAGQRAAPRAMRLSGPAAAAMLLLLVACDVAPAPSRHDDAAAHAAEMSAPEGAAIQRDHRAHTTSGEHSTSAASRGQASPAAIGAADDSALPTGTAGAIGADTIVVSPDGPLTRVADALRLVRTGGVVLIDSGTYREPTLLIDRSVSLVGRVGAVLDGEGSQAILEVRADDVTVRGLAFLNVGASVVEDRAAIRVTDSRNCVIEGNDFGDTFFGIYLASVQTCRVAGNRLRGLGTSEATSGNGIHLWTSRDVTIEDNDIRGHRDGIYLEFATSNRIRRNHAEGNVRYGLHFMFSGDCRYEENVFRHNQAGVAVMYTKGVVMARNRFEGNWGAAAYGLLLKEISDAEVRENHFERNTTALVADGANRLVAEDNRFIGNGWALRLMASSGEARIARNDFIGNSFDVATNSRRSYSTFAGNYWDGYHGYDVDGDGVGDLPHRPVRLFSQIVERFEPTLVLQRSFFLALLDGAERAIPALTPEGMLDPSPSMMPLR